MRRPPADFLDARTDGDRRGFPSEPEFWQGLAATCAFRDRTLATVRLHPLDLGHGRRARNGAGLARPRRRGATDPRADRSTVKALRHQDRDRGETATIR